MHECYRVSNWDEIYENNRTREVKTLHWIPVPIKLAGDGYTLIMDKEDGAAIFGTFIAILEIAASCEPRGTLLRRDNLAHTCDTIARMSRVPATLVRRTIDVCTKETMWLEIIDLETGATISQEGATISQEGAPRQQYITEHNNTRQKSNKPRARERFTPPTVQEIAEYCRQRNNTVNPHAFHDHYATRNWIPKGYTRQMSDWKAAVRTWERNSKQQTPEKLSRNPEDFFVK